jgi:pimeloyl-ACP methyl ester carboxylesterase
MSALPAPVAGALEHPSGGRRSTTMAAGIPYSAIEWGDPSARPLVLIHGVTASARIWWRVGPALATSGRRVIAVDQSGHGLTGHWRGHYRFRDNAADLAAWIREVGQTRADLQIVGHSWGAMTAAALPRAGIRPATLVLLDPPALPYERIAALATDPSEKPYDDMDEAIASLTSANPTWSRGDVEAKAEALIQVDAEAAREILLENHDWDGGLADMVEAVAAGVPTWLIRADPATGGHLPDERLPAFEALLGADRVITLPGTPHAPQRTHPTETTRALLDALG